MSGTGNVPDTGRAKADAARVSGLMRRASSLAERGMYDEAIASIRQAMAISPLEPRCSMELANIYRAQNRIGAAVQAMQRAAELDPMNANLQEQLLQTLIELGRYDDAVTAGRRVLQHFPRNIYARDVMGVAYIQQGEIDKALQMTNDLIRLVPTDPAHYFKKAVLLQQKGLIPQSMAAFLRTLELDPDGELAEDTLEAVAALDSYQLRQVLTLALEDSVFRTKLMLDPETATNERGFILSSSGLAALRQLDVAGLPREADNRFYH